MLSVVSSTTISFWVDQHEEKINQRNSMSSASVERRVNGKEMRVEPRDNKGGGCWCGIERTRRNLNAEFEVESGIF